MSKQEQLPGVKKFIPCAWATFWFCFSPYLSTNPCKLAFNGGTHLLLYGIKQILVSTLTSLIIITAAFLIIRSCFRGIWAQGIMASCPWNIRPLFFFISIILNLISWCMDPFIIVIIILCPFPTIYIRISFIHFFSGILSSIIIITTSPCLNWPTALLLFELCNL